MLTVWHEPSALVSASFWQWFESQHSPSLAQPNLVTAIHCMGVGPQLSCSWV